MALVMLTLAEFDRYVAHYRECVRENAKRDGWSSAETACALGAAEETTRKVFKRNGYKFPQRRKKHVQQSG
jgi:hypothetical protein